MILLVNLWAIKYHFTNTFVFYFYSNIPNSFYDFKGLKNFLVWKSIRK